jgi:glycine oxidase
VLIRALKHALARSSRVRVVADAANEVHLRPGHATVRTRGGDSHQARRLVLATGAWAPELAGLPRALPVAPVRGQMMSVASRALRHVVFAGGGYAVPRPDGRTLVGSTYEHVGFDGAHTEAGAVAVRDIAGRISPALGGAPRLNVWAGLRPMTPDGQPIVGVDPRHPALVYACGHSRNGVLLAPLTGSAAAALALGEAPAVDLTPYRVDRFDPATVG